MARLKQDFTKEDPWRIFRIMSEFVDGFETMADVDNGVAIFGSSCAKPASIYYKMAEETGRLLAKAGYAVITGAGPGIMEAANKGAKLAGGESIGLNILIPARQVPNKYITRLIEFKYFFCRKVVFAKNSKAFVVFPGGFGTLDELFEAITLIQTERIEPFPVILLGKDYWSGLMKWLSATALKAGFIEKDNLHLFSITDSPSEAVATIKRFYK